MRDRKIPREDKKCLNAEAQQWDFHVLPNGRVYHCIESANEHTFAWWQRVNPWRQPLNYLIIRSLNRKAHK